MKSRWPARWSQSAIKSATEWGHASNYMESVCDNEK